MVLFLFRLLCYASQTYRCLFCDLLLCLFFFFNYSLMLKLLAYFDEATVLLYFAQSVLVKISTNPLSAQLRRRIVMAKRDVYVPQNINRRYSHDCAVIVLIKYRTQVNTWKWNAKMSVFNRLLLSGNPIMHYTNNDSQQMLTRTLFDDNKSTL